MFIYLLSSFGSLQKMPFGQFRIHVCLSVLLPDDQLLWHSTAVRPHEHDPDDPHIKGERSSIISLNQVFTNLLFAQLVGLAFEVNTAYTNAKADANDVAAAKEQEMFANLGVSDIFHYAFNYIGVLTGN